MPEDTGPILSAREYRRQEAEMRKAAEAAQLPHLQEKYLTAAERWAELAQLQDTPSQAGAEQLLSGAREKNDRM